MSEFTDCYQYHVGVVSGALISLGAPQDAIASLRWLVSQLNSDSREAEVDHKFDQLLGETPRQKAVDAVRQGAPSSKAPVKEWEDEEPAPRRKRRDSNGIAASEPPRNGLGLPEWGEPSGTFGVRENPCGDCEKINGKNYCTMNCSSPAPAAPSVQRSARGWTASQEDELIAMVRAGDTPAKCALHFNKGYQATYGKITALKEAGRI